MASETGSYEFTEGQNEVLAHTATWAGVLAWVMIVSAGLMALGGVVTGDAIALAALFVSPIYLIIGIQFRSAAVSMKSVVETAGNDIDHLMTAFAKLGGAFKVMGILFLVGVLLFLGSVVVFPAIWPV